MKAPFPGSRSGAVLVITLILVTAIALLVVSYFSLTRQEATISSAVVSDTRAELGERAAFEEAGSLLRSLTGNDEYLVSAILERESPDKSPTRYTYVSTPNASGVVHTPLFAGGLEKRVDLPNISEKPTPDLADGAVGAPEFALDGTGRSGFLQTFLLSHLSSANDLESENRKPTLGYREIEPTGSSPFRIRYTYWMEDLEGYPNSDVVGTWTDHFDDGSGNLARDFVRLGYSRTDSRTRPPGGASETSVTRFGMEDQAGVYFQFPAAFRGQTLVDQVAPGLSTRETAPFPWATDSFPIAEHPFYHTAEFLAERHLGGSGIISAQNGSETERSRFATGLQPYSRIPLIPFSHGYVDEGKPRHQLNKFVADRDIGMAAIIERNLPDFEKRKGGFPDGEDYVATIAANAIDYADEDSLPSLKGNTTGSGARVFRGVDSYCPVNEFFVRFNYIGYESAGANDLIVFEAVPYAEFWNPSNQTAKMENVRLNFRFIERIRFQANSKWIEIRESHINKNEPYPSTGGISVTVAPNAFQVVSFGKIRWKVPVAKDPLIAYPVVQKIQGVSNVSVRAHYELYLGTDLVDRCSREENPAKIDYGFFFPQYAPVINPGESFMRLATANLAATAYGFNAGYGSHLGDPWMPYYSRSTVEDAQYRLKGTPGSRNVDRSKVAASRPDWFKDQTRVRDWPDRGFDPVPGPTYPASDLDSPDTFNRTPLPEQESLAPWRISNRGRFYSVTELGNLHDPVMWVPGPTTGTASIIAKQSTQLFGEYRHTSLKSLPPDATAGKMWGGGNTLRIGRAEHEKFDKGGMRASQLLDLFHTGYTGTNLGATDGDDESLYLNYDPRDHQPPPSGSDPLESSTKPYQLLYDPDLNAQGQFALVYGHLNLNSVPTLFEMEMLLRGPFVSSDIRLTSDHFITPTYARDGNGEVIRSGLKTEAIPEIARGLYAARPFYSPSHFARVLSHLIERHQALPEHCNDAQAEETFARVFNTTSLSSRHFRIFTGAEVYHAGTGEIVGRSRRVYEVFLRPLRDASGAVVSSKLEVSSSRDL